LLVTGLTISTLDDCDDDDDGDGDRHRVKNIPKAIKKNEGFFFDKLTFEGLEAPYFL